MPKYLDPKNDVAFKKIFIENKDLMISFLNALLPLPDDCEIIDLQYESKELLPDSVMLKDSFVDVRCLDSKGRHFIVEMQMYWRKALLRRMLFNTAKVYVRELKVGDDYSKLRPVYGLAILNDIMDANHTHYYHRYRMTEETHPEETIDGLDITLIELPLFQPSSVTGKKMKDLWITFLIDTGKDTTEEEIPQSLKDNDLTARALELCKIGAYSEAELAGYERYVEKLAFHLMEIAEGREEGEAIGEAIGEARGLAKGKAEGKAEGRQEAFIEIAKNMKAKGKSVDEIADMTGLSAEEIGRL